MSNHLSYQFANPLSQEPSHIYYDLNIVNNDTTGTKAPVKINFNEIRNSPIILNPEDYFVSVVRFKLETSYTLPAYVPQIQLNQMDANKTIYSFTMSYLSPVNFVNYEFQQYITWSPENLTATSPPTPTVLESQSSPYYYGYNFQHFVDLMNVALQACITSLNSVVLTATGSGITNYLSFPFFLLDQNTKRMSLVARESVYGDAAGIHKVKIWCNSPMFNLISSFQARYYGESSSITNGKNFEIIIKNINNTNYYLHNNNASPPTFLYNGLQMFQEYSVLSLWSPIDKIQFTSSLLPISPSLTGKPLVYNSDTSQTQSGNNANITLNITDFQQQTDDGGVLYKPYIAYIPQSEYRFIDLFGNNPISAVEINVFWVDKFGNSNPFFLASSCNASIKLLFRRKDFNNMELDSQ